MKNKNTLLVFALVIFSLLIGVVIYYARQKSKIERPDENIVTMDIISKLLVSYHRKHGEFPMGDSSHISAAIIEEFGQGLPDALKSGSIDGKEQFADRFGNTIQIKTSEINGVYLASAGKNKVFGDSDDIHHYREINENSRTSYAELARRWGTTEKDQ